MAKLGFLFGLLSMVALPQGVWAQRGQAFTSVEAPKGVTDGFPGFFDGGLAESGSWVLHLPSGSIDYGLSRRVTLGLSLVPTLAAAMGGGLGLGGRIRVGGWSDRSWTTTFELGFVRLATTDEGLNLAHASGHLVWVLTPDQRLTTSLYVAHGWWDGDDGHRNLIYAGVTHQLAFTQRWLLETSVLTDIYGEASLGRSFVTEGWSLAPGKLLKPMALRASVGYRAGASWLLTGGALFLTGPKQPLPWLGVAWKT